MAGENEDGTMTQEELDRYTDERIQAALATERERHAAELAQREQRSQRLESQLHERTVRDKVQAAQEAGVPAAVLSLAEQVWLADTHASDDEGVLTLSRDGNDVKLSVTAIVDELVEAMPRDLSLARKQPKLQHRAEEPEGQKSVKERADALQKELKEGPAIDMSEAVV